MEEGVNVPENAAELQREMGDRLKELRTETAEGGVPATQGSN
jgi:hypothetical protein